MAQGQNRHTDSLATLASSMTEDVPWIIKVELLVEPSISATIGVTVVSAFGHIRWTQSSNFWLRIEY